MDDVDALPAQLAVGDGRLGRPLGLGVLAKMMSAKRSISLPGTPLRNS